MEADGDVDEGVGCRGVAWVAASAGCVVSERACSPRRRRAAVIEPSRGGGTNPVASPASAPLAAGACGPLGVRCGDVSRTMARSALSCTGVHGPPGACTRAHSAAAAAIARHAATAAGVGAGAPRSTWSSLCAGEGAVPAAQSPAHSGLACAFLARGGTNAGRRVPARLPEVRSGETELPPGVWPSRQRLGLALASTPVGSSPTRWTAESRRSPTRRAGSQRLTTRRTVSRAERCLVSSVTARVNVISARTQRRGQPKL